MKAEIINGKAITIKEISNQRLITFKEIDEVHERPDGTAKRNFTKNKKHLIKNEDYYTLKPADLQKYEIRTSEFDISQINNRGTTLLTESGYLMIVKSLNDDLAWKVQRQLVNIYFRAKETKVNDSYTVLENSLQMLTAQLTALTTLITSTLPKPYNPPLTRWISSIYIEVDKIASALDLNRRQMLHKLFTELQDTYDIDLAKYQYDYCFRHNLKNTGKYTMNAIEDDSQLKQAFQLLVDNYIEECSLNNSQEKVENKATTC